MQNSPVRGMLTVDRLREMVAAAEIETVLLVFTDMYGRFMGKRYDAEFFLESGLDHGTHCCNYLLTVDLEMEPVPGYEYANWELGYGDFHLVPDLDTLRLASWLEKSAMVICDVYEEGGDKLVPFAPRSILRRQLLGAEELGYTVNAASELEYFIFSESYRDANRKNYHQLEPLGWYIEDYEMMQGAREEKFTALVRRHLKQSGVPVENSKGEWGRGQHELNIRYADLLTMCDRHAIYKQCLKETADQLGLSVTFMAKVDAGEAGSSSHMHLSLWQGGENQFAGELQFGPIRGSDLFRWFLGGWMAHIPEMMVFYAPTVNSYKRFIAGSWAPTGLAWSHDNRTAGFRVVGKGASLRIECRIPGADCNPYLAYAAALASGLDGIRNQIEPPLIFEGDVYSAKNLPQVPRSLAEAIELFSGSDFAQEALGADVLRHYAHFFRTEQEAYDRAVTDWERRRYFERI